MQVYSAVWGVDIGHASIKAVKLLDEGGKVAVSAYAIEPIEVVDEEARPAAVEGASTNSLPRRYAQPAGGAGAVGF